MAITHQGILHQDWSIGSKVKVGFMTLTVVTGPIQNEDPFLPNYYVLTNGKGAAYRFTPHNGCERIN